MKLNLKVFKRRNKIKLYFVNQDGWYLILETWSHIKIRTMYQQLISLEPHLIIC